MQSNKKNPLLFFEVFLESGIQHELKKFYESTNNRLTGSPQDTIDKENHIVSTYDSQINQIVSYSFENYLKPLINKEIQHSKELIDYEFQIKYSNPKEVAGYFNWLTVKLNSLKSLKSYSGFSFSPAILERLFNLIEVYSSKKILHSSLYSFNIQSHSIIEQKAKISKLYELLTSQPALIESGQEEFLKAFSGQVIENGVKWLVKGKNGLISKVSLFYFIDELINSEHLERNIISDESKYITYVFRDAQGNKLQHLKQSKSTISNSPAQKDRIDEIINQL